MFPKRLTVRPTKDNSSSLASTHLLVISFCSMASELSNCSMGSWTIFFCHGNVDKCLRNPEKEASEEPISTRIYIKGRQLTENSE